MDVLSKCHPSQMSSDSGMFENPFREGGKLSRDAEVIIDALKTGKLSVISNQVREAETSREIHIALHLCIATAYGSVLLYQTLAL